MIARLWAARARRDGVAGYREHLARRVVPELRRLPGYLGVTLLAAPADPDVEVTVITRWSSLLAIRAFAGADLERAVVADEALPFLISWDERVRHHEILLQEDAGTDS